MFEGCIVLHNDANQIQGFPDLLILWEDKWAALEVKQNSKARFRPNQEYYIDLLDSMSFASAIWPSNKEEILDELQQTFISRRTTRLPRRE